MFNSEKTRKTMLVVMFLELLILLGLLVNDHIQAENNLRKQVHTLAAQVAVLTQEQQKTAAELTTAREELNATKVETKALDTKAQSLTTELQNLKKTCTGKSTCCKSERKQKCDSQEKQKCKSKCKGKSDCGNSCKGCPNKDKPSNKKPECGNDKGTTSPPAQHQVEMYYGATKVIISVPQR